METIKVKDWMAPLHELATFDQAIHQLIIGHIKPLMVTSKDKIVCILSLTDVFRQIGSRMKACNI